MSKIFLNGYGDIKIQCLYNLSLSSSINNHYAMILHPHPLYGGTMHNKVVFNIYKTLKNLGFATLRYNSRGVEKSEGAFTNGDLETKDAEILLHWLMNQDLYIKNRKFYIIGFSFGAYIVKELLLHKKYPIEKYIMLAPPSNLFTFDNLTLIKSEGLIIHGTDDEIVPIDATEKLLKANQTNIIFKKIDKAGHFFEGFEKELSDGIIDFIKN